MDTQVYGSIEIQVTQCHRGRRKAEGERLCRGEGSVTPAQKNVDHSPGITGVTSCRADDKIRVVIFVHFPSHYGERVPGCFKVDCIASPERSVSVTQVDLDTSGAQGGAWLLQQHTIFLTVFIEVSSDDCCTYQVGR